MRPITYVLAAIGVLLAMFGVVNHYLLNIAPIAHTSTVLVGLGAILFLVGLVTSFKDDRSTVE